MSRALLLLALSAALLAQTIGAAEVFVIADTANQTRTITAVAKETIAEANELALEVHNDTLADPEDEHEPVVRRKRTFGDVVFRGLADVLGYNVARKPPQVVFPPPLAPVPGIDAPLQVALVPVLAAPVPQAGAPAPCGRAVTPCAPPPPPPPPAPKQTQPPCPRPRANPRPRPKPRPRPTTPAPPPPCARPRANPSTPAPCTPPAPPPAPPKADSNLETISSNFRLNFNFNRAPATTAPAALPAAATDQQDEEQEEQEQVPPVAIQPRAAKLPQDPPRKPRVYLDAFVVRNGVPQRVHTVDAQSLNNPQADDDYLVYDDEQPQQNQDDDYEYVQESRDRAKAVKEFGTAVDRFWEQKQKPNRKLPANDYRNVHFGDRNLANQILQAKEEKLQTLQKRRSKANSIPSPVPKEEDNDEEAEATTPTQDPRRPLKPRVLPPTEQNPSQIDTITVRVPPIYKEKRPKKLHRGRTERPERDEEVEEEAVESSDEHEDNYDSDTENSSPIEQTEPPRRKRRRKNKRRVRSVSGEAYSAGDYDYYGKRLPMSEEEEFFRGLTVPPPTKDADLARIEEGEENKTPFLDDHERLRDDSEKIIYDNRNKNDEKDSEEEDRADEAERADSEEKSVDDTERTGDRERADETERSDRLSPNAQVRETGYENKYVRASNVQIDDPDPLVATVKRKTKNISA